MPELSRLETKLRADRLPYCLATVVTVRGSASAKPGSKMLISQDGKNLWGWVGGGCAESFTISNALEALEERRPRMITADLDDEVFGLGMPCGGTMDIFVEPITPAERLAFPKGPPALRALSEHYGFEAEIGSSFSLSNAECIFTLAKAIAHSRNADFLPLSGKSNERHAPPAELLILGHSRITEELAKLGALLAWPTRVYGLGLESKSYPSAVSSMPAQPDYAGLEVKPDSFVVVASHHKGDHHYIAEALKARAAYVGLVSSRKRAGLVLEHLAASGVAPGDLAKVHSPCGLNLAARNPGEIALSIVAGLLR